MSCMKLTPYKIADEVFINAEKLLPLMDYEDYYVNLMEKTPNVIKQQRGIKRRSLPKIDEMLQWGVVKEGKGVLLLQKVRTMK